eukprot:6884641-Prymnesium_polylepis.1
MRDGGAGGRVVAGTSCGLVGGAARGGLVAWVCGVAWACAVAWACGGAWGGRAHGGVLGAERRQQPLGRVQLVRRETPPLCAPLCATLALGGA